jgi:hypothetical protein
MNTTPAPLLLSVVSITNNTINGHNAPLLLSVVSITNNTINGHNGQWTVAAGFFLQSI